MQRSSCSLAARIAYVTCDTYNASVHERAGRLTRMDRVSAEKRSQIMAQVRSKNTGPELDFRRLLHRKGFRYRLHKSDLPGCPDVVLSRHRIVIFVHGCFWHGHAGCPKGKLPKSNLNYWQPKLEATRARDRKAQLELGALGWTPLVVWQCEIRNLLKDPSSFEVLMPILTARSNRQQRGT